MYRLLFEILDKISIHALVLLSNASNWLLCFVVIQFTDIDLDIAMITSLTDHVISVYICEYILYISKNYN